MNEVGIKRVLKKLYFFCLPTQPMRSRFIQKHAKKIVILGMSFLGNQDAIPLILN